MTIWRTITSLCAFSILVTLHGCVAYRPLLLSPSNRPTDVVERSASTVEGWSCQYTLFGISLGAGNTLREALDEAKRNAGTQLLTDITVDMRFALYVVVTSSCTVVRGVPVRG